MAVTPSPGVSVKPRSSGCFPDLCQGDFGSSCLQSQSVTMPGPPLVTPEMEESAGSLLEPAPRAGGTLQTLFVALEELMVG